MWEGKWSPCQPLFLSSVADSPLLSQNPPALKEASGFMTVEYAFEKCLSCSLLTVIMCCPAFSQEDQFYSGTNIWFLLQLANFLPSFQFAEHPRGWTSCVATHCSSFWHKDLLCWTPKYWRSCHLRGWSSCEAVEQKAEKFVWIIVKLILKCLFFFLVYLPYQIIKSWILFSLSYIQWISKNIEVGFSTDSFKAWLGWTDQMLKVRKNIA